MADAVVRDERTGEPRIRHPKPTCALDQLPGRLATLHVVGCLRALNSALDCLAGTIVGVAAIPTDIQRATFGSVWHILQGRARETQPNHLQRELGEALASEQK